MSPLLVVAHLADAVARSGAPLDPGGDDARRQLRRELVRPEYNRTDPLQRLLDWLERLVQRGVDAASGAPSIATAVTVLVVILLLAAAVTLAARTRRSAREQAPRETSVLGTSLSAAQLRDRAERALAAGDAGAALLDAFRAAATRQVERHRVSETPQATALEVARSLGALAPALADDALRAAGWFDEVLYGDRPASADQARAVLDLDTALDSSRDRAALR